MAIDQKFLRESVEVERSFKERVAPLVKRWKRSGLLEGLNSTDQHTLSLLLQNQAKRLYKEASRTSSEIGHEEWSDIALPMVRKVFVEQLSKQLVHTFSMDKADGLVFYLDFEHDVDKPEDAPIYTEGESVYGVTDEEADPSGSFYGATRYSYSMNYQKASVVASAEGTTVTDHKVLGFDPSLSATFASGQTDARVAYFDVEIDPELRLDLEALETHTVEGNVDGIILRQHTRVVESNGDTFLRFFHAVNTGVITVVPNDEPLVLHYTVQPVNFDRGDYEQGKAGVGPIDEINIKITQKNMVAKTRKLKTVITPEMIQDLEGYQAIDAQREVVNILSGYIEGEEDLEILNMLSKASRPITRYWSASIGRWTDGKTGASTQQATFTLGANEWYKTLGIRIRDISNSVYQRNLRGRLNWMVASPKVSTILESFNTYKVAPEAGGATFSMGVEQSGTLEGRMKIYTNPYWKENEILMGFKGSSVLEAGAAYGTYIPFMLTPPITDPKTFDIVQGIMTRNAKLVLRSDFYARILIRDLEAV